MTVPASRRPAEARTIDLRTAPPSTDEQRDAYVTLLEDLTHALVVAESMRNALVLQCLVYWLALLGVSVVMIAAEMQWMPTWPAPLLVLVALLLPIWIDRRAKRQIRALLEQPIERVTVGRDGGRIVAELHGGARR